MDAEEEESPSSDWKKKNFRGAKNAGGHQHFKVSADLPEWLISKNTQRFRLLLLFDYKKKMEIVKRERT